MTRLIVALLVACSWLPVAAQAAFPEKLIRLVVPFAAGGGTDLIARRLGEGMSKELGQPVIIDNKPGAGTIIGSEAVAHSPPDGYTIVIASFAHAVNPSLVAKMPFDTEKVFSPIILIGRSPNILVVKAESPYKTVADVIAAAKAKPGTLTFASQGNGTSAHLAGELFKSLAKVDMTHVPYRGAGPALMDLLAGQVDTMFATASAVGAFLDSGKLRGLAVTTGDRSPARPTLPTIAESGVPGYAAESWYGLYAPAGTPAEVIAILNAATKKAAQGESFRKQVAEEGLVIDAGDPAQLERYVGGQTVLWAKIVKDAHITTD